MESNIIQRIDNQQKAIKLFQHLLDNHDNPPEVIEELEEEIEICKKLKSDLEKMTLGTKEVIFEDCQVEFFDEKPFSKTYPLLLVEHIILQGKIHWLWSFIFLGAWTTGKVLSNHPKTQTGNALSKKEVKKLKEYGIHIDHRKGEDEWRIKYKNEQLIRCNLVEAKKNYDQAKEILEKNNLEKADKIKAINKLKKAIAPCRYAEIHFIDAYKLLIKEVLDAAFENVTDTELKKMKGFLRWYKLRLEESLFVIEKIYILYGKIDEIEIENEFKELQEEQEIISKYYQCIKNKMPFTKEEEELEQLSGAILNLRWISEEKRIELKERELFNILDEIYHTEEFINLVENKHINEVFKYCMEKFGGKDEYLDWEGRLEHMKYFLFASITGIGDIDINEINSANKKIIEDISIGGISPNKHATVGSIKKELRKQLIKKMTAYRKNRFKKVNLSPEIAEQINAKKHKTYRKDPQA